MRFLGDQEVYPTTRYPPNYRDETPMANVIRCRDVGFDCDGVIRVDTEEEALQQAAEHAKAVHGLDEITDDVVAQVKAAMREV